MSTPASTPIGQDQKYCSECGTVILRRAEICPACGCRQSFPSALNKSGFPPFYSETAPKPQDPIPSLDQFPSLSPYYREEFAKMQADPLYQGKWNWAAFCFCCLWAITKGLWAPTLLCLGVLVFSLPVGGLPALLFWFYFGARGNSMYYKKTVLGQQWALW